jgi:hypothetical protein
MRFIPRRPRLESLHDDTLDLLESAAFQDCKRSPTRNSRLASNVVMASHPVRPQGRNSQFFLLLILIVAVSPILSRAWAQNEQQAPTPPPRQTRMGPVYPTHAIPPDENPRYFPDGTFNGRPGIYDGGERFCAWYFRTMNEPSLLDESKQQNIRVYRFLKLPPFFHPWSVRITILLDGTGQAVAKTTDGTGGFSPGYHTKTQTVEVPKPIVDRFLHLLDNLAFWSMPTELSSHFAVMGGTPWMLEGAESGRYHVVERVSPSHGPFAMLCAFMLEEMGKVDSIPHRIRPTDVPPEVAAAVPYGYKARAFTPTVPTKLGGTLLVYEKDEAPNADPHIVVMRSGQIIENLSGSMEGCYTSGFKEFPLDRSRQAVGVAFRCGGDGTISRFVLFTASGESYQEIFRQDAALGALQIWGNPGRFDLFSARSDLDRGESCLYCLHRYTIRTFVWKGDHFHQAAKETPQYDNDPNVLAENPFIDFAHPETIF